MKKNLTTLLMACAVYTSGLAQTTATGPSSSQSPYFQPTMPGYSVTSVISATDVVAGYTMSGIPDGLGAFDNGNGTFTLLMNHEIAIPGGIARAHGSNGAFVSKWVINKSTLAVVSGTDLMQNVNLWNPATSTYSTYNATTPSTLAAFSRFCSADLPATTALYNNATGRGTQERIFMNGEESGNEGRLMAHIVTGTAAGNSYELPFLGKYSCENICANPHRSDKTIVIGMDDTTPGQVYVYVGNKTTTGTDITKAGLTGGVLYGVSVSGLLNEVSAGIPTANTSFSLVNLGSIQAITGASLNTLSNNLSVTNFLRPEDGCWDPSNHRDFYFNTTNAFNSPSRVWRLRFNDIENPELGGTITAVLDGTEGQQMLDNMTIDNSGHIMLQEDVGNNAWNGRILQYDIATDVLTPIGQHDPARFITGGANFLTQDEESSGIIDVQSILGPGMFMFTTQAHFSIPGAVYEGGQIMALYNPTTFSSNPEVNVQANSVNIPLGNTSISAGNNTDFGTSNIGIAVTKTFVIQNTGTGILNISGINMTGTNAGDFIILGSPSYPYTIAASASKIFTVQFTPALLGNRSATVNIQNSDYNESLYDFAIQGAGAAPEINLQGNTVTILDGSNTLNTSNNTDFGSVIYNNAITKTFVIQNTGTGTLNISSIAITGATSSMFTLINAPSVPFNLAGNASQTFTIQFLPTAIGTNSALVTINNSDSDESSYDFVIGGSGLKDVGITSLNTFASYITLFPNPAGDKAMLKINSDMKENVSLVVYDVLGKKEITLTNINLQAGSNEISLNTSELTNGTYFITISGSKKSSSLKLIVNH